MGRLMIGSMNGGHARLADWGMSYLDEVAAANIAELGCGGGRNAGELLKRYPSACLTAVDYSELSVARTKAYNKEMIAAGRCRAVQGNVAALDGYGNFGMFLLVLVLALALAIVSERISE